MQITWTIENLDRKADDGFVTTAHWRATATDGDYSATVYGSVGFDGDSPKIPFNQITLSEALNWVWASEGFDKEATEKQLADQIDAIKNPVQESGVPW